MSFFKMWRLLFVFMAAVWVIARTIMCNTEICLQNPHPFLSPCFPVCVVGILRCPFRGIFRLVPSLLDMSEFWYPVFLITALFQSQIAHNSCYLLVLFASVKAEKIMTLVQKEKQHKKVRNRHSMEMWWYNLTSRGGGEEEESIPSGEGIISVPSEGI